MRFPIRKSLLIFGVLLCTGLIYTGIYVGLVAACRPAEPKGDFFQIVRADKKYSVSLDLTDPKNYSGIPAVNWHPMGDTEFCAIQGNVSADIKLPDGKRITEEFSILYIDRDADGIYAVKMDSLGWLKTDKALIRLKREVNEWSADLDSFARYTARAEAISTWMTSWSYGNEWREGFRVQRVGYDLTFVFFIFGNISDGIRFEYDIRLRELGREPTPEPLTSTFTENGIKYQVPSKDSSSSSNSGGSFSYKDSSVSIFEYQGQLQVNNIDAGKVNLGDNVTIDESGSVLVNGLQRIKGLPIRAFLKIRKEPELARFLYVNKGKISAHDAIIALESTDKIKMGTVSITYADVIATIITDADRSLLGKNPYKLSCICSFRDAKGELSQFRVLKLSPEEKAALIQKLQVSTEATAP